MYQFEKALIDNWRKALMKYFYVDNRDRTVNTRVRILMKRSCGSVVGDGRSGDCEWDIVDWMSEKVIYVYPIHFAVKNNDLEVAKVLLKQGAKIDVKSSVKTERKTNAAVQEPSVTTKFSKWEDNCTPLMYAKSKEMKKLLTDWSEKKKKEDKKQKTSQDGGVVEVQKKKPESYSTKFVFESAKKILEKYKGKMAYTLYGWELEIKKVTKLSDKDIEDALWESKILSVFENLCDLYLKESKESFEDSVVTYEGFGENNESGSWKRKVLHMFNINFFSTLFSVKVGKSKNVFIYGKIKK